MAIPHLRARFGGTNHSSLKRKQLDLGGHKVFYQMGGCNPTSQSHMRSCGNFIKENIIARFGIPHKIISDNGTPFVNKEVRRMLEHFQVKFIVLCDTIHRGMGNLK